MHVRKRPYAFEAPAADVTPEHVYWTRRSATKGILALAASGSSAGLGGCTATGDPDRATDDGETEVTQGFSVARNRRYDLGDEITAHKAPLRWNNYFEFGSNKDIWEDAQALSVRPWQIRLDGLVEKPSTFDVDDLFENMPLEERVYRHRCIEKWAFVAPWIGFPLNALVDYAQPLATAKYVRFESFLNPFVATGQFKFWHPWPYYEGLTITEATHDLPFMVVGAYGKPLPKQNGAPLRLAVPWKYGYKSIKAIQRITFTSERPGSFWADSRPSDFGFWANINPDFEHPYAPQKQEYILGTESVRATKIYNGYADFVSDIYSKKTDENIFM